MLFMDRCGLCRDEIIRDKIGWDEIKKNNLCKNIMLG
jgi:hypothetical protein